MEYTTQIILATFAFLFAFVYKRLTSSDDVSSLQGPSSRSWLYGNMVEFVLGIPAGKTEMSWFEKYGNIFKFHACFGEERLMISDPAAIRYMMQNTHLFVKSSKFQLINRLGFGESSLTYAEGDIHRRIRAIMNPVFSAANVRASTPTLEKIAQNLCDEWTPNSGTIINAYHALHKATLYAITEAVMGYDSANDKEYASVYKDLLVSVSQRSKAGIVIDGVVSLLPQSSSGLLEKYPPPDLKPLLDHRSIARKISETLLSSRLTALRSGEAQEGDLLSILVRNNEKAKTKMSEDEINSQFGMMIVAGEDTTANSLVWVLYVLSRNKKWQDTLRQEIDNAYAENNGKMDYDHLPFLNAVIKEVLRFYPTGPFTERIVAADAILPLSTPIATSSGKTVTEVKMKRGRTIVISMTGYNRLSSIWGDDADELNPYRWLDGRDVTTGTTIGPYANLLTFIGGPRTCIGWRFAILEIQVVVSHLIRQFSFSLPDDVSIEPANAITLVPMDADEKMHLPLLIERL